MNLDNYLSLETRVNVIAGPLQGHSGTVIRDDGTPEAAWRDRVWVLLDVGDNPQHFRHNELARA